MEPDSLPVLENQIQVGRLHVHSSCKDNSLCVALAHEKQPVRPCIKVPLAESSHRSSWVLWLWAATLHQRQSIAQTATMDVVDPARRLRLPQKAEPIREPFQFSLSNRAPGALAPQGNRLEISSPVDNSNLLRVDTPIDRRCRLGQEGGCTLLTNGRSRDCLVWDVDEANWPVTTVVFPGARLRTHTCSLQRGTCGFRHRCASPSCEEKTLDSTNGITHGGKTTCP